MDGRRYVAVPFNGGMLNATPDADAAEAEPFCCSRTDPCCTYKRTLVYNYPGGEMEANGRRRRDYGHDGTRRNSMERRDGAAEVFRNRLRLEGGRNHASSVSNRTETEDAGIPECGPIPAEPDAPKRSISIPVKEEMCV